jgi:hypothetical protein
MFSHLALAIPVANPYDILLMINPGSAVIFRNLVSRTFSSGSAVDQKTGTTGYPAVR